MLGWSLIYKDADFLFKAEAIVFTVIAESYVHLFNITCVKRVLKKKKETEK